MRKALLSAVRCQTHLCEQQEVVEQEAVELFAAFGLEQLPAVEELPGPQTVGDRVKHQLLRDKHRDVIAIINPSIVYLCQCGYSSPHQGPKQVNHFMLHLKVKKIEMIRDV